MIKSINDLHELTILLRSQLIEQSQLPSDYVINGLDTYGPELIKYIEDLDIYKGYELEDTVIVFELYANNDQNITTDEENDIMYSFNSYTLHLIIYGENSNVMSRIIKSRFESEEVRLLLHDDGVHLVKVDLLGDINEFINERIWLRSDVNINIMVRYEIEKVSKIESMDNLKELEVIKNN